MAPHTAVPSSDTSGIGYSPSSPDNPVNLPMSLLSGDGFPNASVGGIHHRGPIPTTGAVDVSTHGIIFFFYFRSCNVFLSSFIETLLFRSSLCGS